MPGDTPEYRQVTQEDVLRAFHDAAAGSHEDQDAFFNGFKYVQDILQGDAGAGVTEGLHLLASCRAWDANAYEGIHKGSIFYWLGIGAFRVHDHEIATFFFDAAVSEDLRAGRLPDDPSPALRFILLDGDPPEQAAHELVQLAQRTVGALLADYSGRSGAATPPIDLPDLRRHFLRRAVSPGGEALRSMATAFVSFALEWPYRRALLDLRPSGGTAEPFFLHLFKGCVLFESLLKANPHARPKALTLGKVLDELATQLGPANLPAGPRDFGSILADLSSADEAIQTAIRFAYMVRNTTGHNLGWVVALNEEQYGRLFRMIASSCLHAVASLYR